MICYIIYFKHTRFLNIIYKFLEPLFQNIFVSNHQMVDALLGQLAIAFILPNAKVQPHNFSQFVDNLSRCRPVYKIVKRFWPLCCIPALRAFTGTFGTHRSNIGTKASGAEQIRRQQQPNIFHFERKVLEIWSAHYTALVGMLQSLRNMGAQNT